MTSDFAQVVADTHTIVWHLNQSPRLSETARELMRSVDRGEAELIVPTIVLAEVLRISERKQPVVSFAEVLDYIEKMTRVVVAPFDYRVLTEVRQLPSALEMHDRIIAATARVYGAKLISRDRQLGSLVETVW